MINKKRFLLYIARTIQTQLFLTLISLPILISWGIPITPLSLVSTPLIAPFLIAFLFVSSMIFFLTLFHIPCSFFIATLDVITKIWLWVLNIKTTSWMIGFRTLPVPLLLLIPIGACYIIYDKRLGTTIFKKNVSLFLFFISICGITKIAYAPINQLQEIACHKSSVSVLCIDQQIIVIDPGLIGSRPSANTWITYTLIPEITARFGATDIDHFITLRCNYFTLQALTTACTKINIGHIYLPKWHGYLPVGTWRAYKEFIETAEQQNSAVTWLKKDQNSIIIPSVLSLSYTGNVLNHKEYTYPIFSADGSIDNTQFTIYATKKGKKECYE